MGDLTVGIFVLLIIGGIVFYLFKEARANKKANQSCYGCTLSSSCHTINEMAQKIRASKLKN
jgi:hypothetical protein